MMRITYSYGKSLKRSLFHLSFFLLSETVDIWNWGDNSDTSHSVFLCVHHLVAKETTP